MSRVPLRSAAFLAALTAIVSCGHAQTQLIVVVDSDLEVPAEVTQIHVRITSALDRGGSADHVYALRGMADAGPTRFALPLSFGVAPGRGDPSDTVTIVVEAQSASGSTVVSRTAQTGFVAGQALLLPIFLPRACAMVHCEADETCGNDGVCVAVAVPTTSLSQYSPGSDLSHFDVAHVPADVTADAPNDTPGMDAIDAMDATDATDVADVADASDTVDIVDVISTTVMPPRPIGPPSESIVTNATPRLEWTRPTGTDGAIVELCTTRACTSVTTITATGDSVDLTASQVRHGWNYWRLRGTSGALISASTSAVWQFYLPPHAHGVHSGHYGAVLDWNGDGNPDVAVGVPGSQSISLWNGTGGSFAGSPTATRSVSGTAGAGFAAFVKSVGDVDGNGFSDLLVIAQGTTSPIRDAVAFVYHSDGTILADPPDMIPLSFTTVHSASWAGDLNHDGYADIVIGSTDGLALNHDSGEVTIIYGSASPLTAASTHGNGGPGYVIGVSGAGDLNGDGFDDVAVSTDTYSGSFGPTAASIWTGGAGTSIGEVAATIDEPASEHFAGAVAAGCDFDQDGWPDVALNVRSGGSGGSAGVFRYSSSGTIHPTFLDSTLSLQAVPSGFSCGGDVNGDGYDDLVFGTSTGSAGQSLVYVWSAPSSTPPHGTFNLIASSAVVGTILDVVGDYNSDGLVDFAVGDPNAGAGGQVLVSSGSPVSPYFNSGASTETLFVAEATFGAAVAMADPLSPRATFAHMFACAPRHEPFAL